MLRTMSIFESGLGTGEIDFKSLFEEGTRVAAISGPKASEYAEFIVKGGWPRTQDMAEDLASLYLQNYIENISMTDIGGGFDAMRMKSLIRSLARNISTEASITNIAGESKIFGEDAKDETTQSMSIPTTRKYMDALAKIFVLEELHPWATHIRSKVRQRVSPKWHYVDPSIAAAALQISSSKLLEDPEALGLFFESLCIRDLRIFAGHMGGNVSYYRDEKNLEVDAIVELLDGRWAGFEVKLGGDAHIEAAAKSLFALTKKLSDSKQKEMTSLNILTAGSVSYTRPDGVNVISLGHIGI